MTKVQLRKAFNACTKLIAKDYGAVPCELSKRGKRSLSRSIMTVDMKNHLLFMCTAGREFVEAGKLEKADRWLGFVQGAMWCMGHASIDAMRKMNMPTEPIKGNKP